MKPSCTQLLFPEPLIHFYGSCIFYFLRKFKEKFKSCAPLITFWKLRFQPVAVIKAELKVWMYHKGLATWKRKLSVNCLLPWPCMDLFGAFLCWSPEHQHVCGGLSNKINFLFFSVYFSLLQSLVFQLTRKIIKSHKVILCVCVPDRKFSSPFKKPPELLHVVLWRFLRLFPHRYLVSEWVPEFWLNGFASEPCQRKSWPKASGLLSPRVPGYYVLIWSIDLYRLLGSVKLYLCFLLQRVNLFSNWEIIHMALFQVYPIGWLIIKLWRLQDLKEILQ